MRTAWLWMGVAGMTLASWTAMAEVMSVQVRETTLRKTPSFLGQTVATVRYGDKVEVLGQQGDWRQVNAGGATGWLNKSALTTQNIRMSGGGQDAQVNASGDEIALAGKGFSKEVEADFKTKNPSANYDDVNAIEKIKIGDAALDEFLKAGDVKPAEGAQ